MLVLGTVEIVIKKRNLPGTSAPRTVGIGIATLGSGPAQGERVVRELEGVITIKGNFLRGQTSDTAAVTQLPAPASADYEEDDCC